MSYDYIRLIDLASMALLFSTFEFVGDIFLCFIST